MAGGCLLLERKAVTNLDSILKSSTDITLPTNVHIVKVTRVPGLRTPLLPGGSRAARRRGWRKSAQALHALAACRWHP